ncbi:hypothetical protein KC19_1G275300 [Ceratodon purpureus]|uniref:EF-hand domain-containing protein n=1 Tax=Ceratodon purpureus TaxID=3225 RepID=A0A8T0JDD4_CERPU|nr:hypothetical protein KC19_1G275300 [Ceratodon purpureus]
MMGNLQTKEQYNAQVRVAVDRIWEKVVSATDEGRIGLQDLYCAILLVYNELNKRLPGPWNEPPSKKEVEAMFEQFDKDNDGKLEKEEFAAFLQGFTKKETTRITTNILLFSFLIPLLVDGTRQITERIPKVGGVVQIVPQAVFSSVVTTAIVLLGTQFRGSMH